MFYAKVDLKVDGTYAPVGKEVAGVEMRTETCRTVVFLTVRGVRFVTEWDLKVVLLIKFFS